jgi:RAT1-interacting protein
MLKYERKLLKFWIQSFLLGVPKIIVGFRNKIGILQRLEELETRALPGLVKRNGRGSWDGNVCINFTASFLDCIIFRPRSYKSKLTPIGLQKTIVSEGVWRIRRKDRSSTIEVFKIEESGHGSILSQEFVSWRENVDGSDRKIAT